MHVGLSISISRILHIDMIFPGNFVVISLNRNESISSAHDPFALVSSPTRLTSHVESQALTLWEGTLLWQ